MDRLRKTGPLRLTNSAMKRCGVGRIKVINKNDYNCRVLPMSHIKQNRRMNAENKWSLEIEALTEASAHLEFIERLCGQLELSFNERQKVEAAIDEIKKRIDTQELRLAIVGEFSSGKSTFINAILRRILLKASLIPTTATATRLYYAKKLEIEAVVDGNRVSGKEANYADLYNAACALKPELYSKASLKDVLEVLTTDSNAGKRVRDVAIGYPSETLRNDLVILDTPGIGTGTDITAYHGDITIDIVKNEADAAVVLLPSNISVTGTMLDFLEAHARHLVSRCIFILTKMDGVDETEREEIVRYVRNTLKERFNMDNPAIHESAALAILRPDSVEKQDYWEKEFQRLETHLVSEVLRLRSVLISENLVRLISALANLSEEKLKGKEKQIAEEEAILRSQQVAELNELMDSLKTKLYVTLEDEYNSCKRKLSSAHSRNLSKLEQDISKHIDDGGWGLQSAYETEFQPWVKEQIHMYTDAFWTEYDGLMSRLVFSRDVAVDHISEEFARHFSMLSSLGYSVNVPVPARNLSSSSGLSDFSRADQIINAANEDDKIKLGRGALAGAVIGSFILPGIGTVIGGFLGTFFGAIFLDLDKFKSDLRSAVLSSTREFMEKNHSAANRDLKSAWHNAKNEVGNLIEKYKRTYSDTVDALRHDHAENVRRIQVEKEQVRRDSEKLNDHKFRLTCCGQRLSKII